MAGPSSPSTKAQLDKTEREHLEDVVTELRETVEADIEYQLEHTYELDEEEGGEDFFGEEADIRAELVRAVKREDENKDWEEKFEKYVMGVGYTIINRLTALRCMEVRGFIERPVTQFGDSGTTPAAEKLETEEFLSPEDALIEAYDRECARLSDEIEILFDLDSPYSIIDPDVETFEEICNSLDNIPEEVWRADDVLGWVYEYYNVSKLDELRHKADNEGLDPEDVPPANQFYTPHWVVRMLTDNSLAKMYLESKGELVTTIEEQMHLSPDERKYRDLSPSSTPSLAEFSTYLVPAEEEGQAPDFDEPEDLRVIDPACGSGHFLLYAFDILERIWYQERPDLDRSEIPSKILQHNLYGVDLDLRACQLAAFNLYLKARGRAEEEGATEFEMPQVGIVCADTKIANVEPASEVFDEVAGDQPEVRGALEDILDAFEGIQGLGSLLDVRGTLEEQFTMEEQPTLVEAIEGPGSLTKFLDNLHEEIAAHRNGESFMAQDLRSFLRVLAILSQDYDVALMNPPYGSGSLMPDPIQEYVENHYKYSPQFYVNFFEVCNELVKEQGRTGMLIPRTFMFKRSFQNFRKDFIGPLGNFDFLAEFGLGILDNATVRTAATVVRKESQTTDDKSASFVRLHDLPADEKETAFLKALFSESDEQTQQRLFSANVSEFSKIPGAPMSYWADPDVRSLFDSEQVLDAENADIDRKSSGTVKAGLTTGNNDRFASYFWEQRTGNWVPLAKGGGESWHVAMTRHLVEWTSDGEELERVSNSYVRNKDFYFSEALTYRYHGEGGRRFGYIPEGAVFHHSGKVFIPDDDPWAFLGYLNSSLVTYLMLCQTPERRWEVSQVSNIPWFPKIADNEEIANYTKELAGLLMNYYSNNITSFNYSGPLLLKAIGTDTSFRWNKDHKFSSLSNDLPEPVQIDEKGKDTSISEIQPEIQSHIDQLFFEITNTLESIDESVLDTIQLSKNTTDTIKEELSIQTPAKGGYEAEVEYFVDLYEPSEEDLVKDLIHHFAVEAVRKEEDGIIPLGDLGEYPSMLDRIEEQFEEIYGRYAEARLEEVDKTLGDKTAADEPYPNLREWLENDLFEFHTSTFENTPILWQLTTERLVSDPQIEGFACFIDYHQLDASLFDQLESHYVESIKTELRQRRNAMDQRRSDSTLSTTEQAEAAEEYERYESALAQIDEFQEAAVELSSEHPREWDDKMQTLAGELVPKVTEFRNRTEERLRTLDKLVNEMDADEFEDRFSPTFLERVNENRDEWIDALDDLEAACRAYNKDVNKPVEAHLYDLFPYFDDIIGSTHYGSNGIFFMNYYFSKGKDYLENGEPREGLAKEIELLAELAAETDKDVELGNEIKEECEELSKAIPSDWRDRAISEVMTAGYDPVQKHGVAINIQPLAEKKIVPEIVEDKVTN